MEKCALMGEGIALAVNAIGDFPKNTRRFAAKP